MKFRQFSITVIMCIATMAAVAPVPENDFKQAILPRDWSFPRDHGRHDGFKLEWWYFTGNLHDASGRSFGYQLTFFRSAFSAAAAAATRPSPWAMKDIYFAHAAVSDISGKTFLFKDRLERARPDLAFSSDQTMDVALLDWSCKLDSGKIHLTAAEKDFTIDLQCQAGRGPVLEGPGGVNVKGHEPGQSSYYYSMTRLKTSGTLTVKKQKFSVEGLSWMDHEFSSDAMAKSQVGWDWMGLELNDGTDLMIYRMRDAGGNSDYLSGTRITPEGQPQYLNAGDLSLKGDMPWKSPASMANYPQRWKVSVTGSPELIVTSAMPGQELITTSSTKVTYFEGVAVVTDERGNDIGQGYLEMTGYAK